MRVDLNRIDDAIVELERAGERLWSRAKTNSEYEYAEAIQRIAQEAKSEYRKLCEEWPRAQALVDESKREYDRYVTRPDYHSDDTRGCSCHISPPCSYCVEGDGEAS